MQSFGVISAIHLSGFPALKPFFYSFFFLSSVFWARSADKHKMEARIPGRVLYSVSTVQFSHRHFILSVIMVNINMGQCDFLKVTYRKRTGVIIQLSGLKYVNSRKTVRICLKVEVPLTWVKVQSTFSKYYIMYKYSTNKTQCVSTSLHQHPLASLLSLNCKSFTTTPTPTPERLLLVAPL